MFFEYIYTYIYIYIYIYFFSGEAVHSQAARQRDDQTDRKQARGCLVFFTQTLGILPPPLMFGRIPICFDTAV